MLKPILACILLAGCTDAFTSTYSSTATSATVTVPTQEVNATMAMADQAAIGDSCARVAAARGSASAQAAVADLRLQAGFSESELALITTGAVATGMSEKAAICALGGNSATVSSVKTITSPGHVNKVFTFEGGLNARLYTDNGIVTALRQ